MNTSFGECLRGVLAGHHLRRIIARRWMRLGALLVLATTLAACTAARLAYNQAPSLSYWWLDSHVNLDDTQSARARQDLDAFFQWHRNSELPVYAGLLRQWQALATQDITPAQACAQFEVVRARLERAAGETVEPFARLALQLSPAQLEHLKGHLAEGNETFEKDFLRGSPEQRIGKRLDKALSRSESLYGKLSAEQRTLLRGLIQTSPFDAQRTQAERLRRQADLAQTVREAQTTPAKAEQLVRAHIARFSQSPTPGYDAYNQTLVREGCAQFATLHNSTTPEQRANAVRVLKGYEDDLRVLSAQR
ncbi:DUF6279 family lipoprotein [Hydrogenophaga sp.]|uniref:DUF6279 family lipoprotein n=1 Tax=Hydrogenophaga sp. TaxID=1904254 RepID=UPI002736156A|nr:DUF6279 family lipoprotein [Hydrogenophaga sp.]MDP3805721.1 DUF6279 family lipoprotein [Hydrogenophaga sp.]